MVLRAGFQAVDNGVEKNFHRWYYKNDKYTQVHF